jgi:hypothetical protein
VKGVTEIKLQPLPVVRFRRNLRNTGRTSNIFDVRSDTEKAQHRALWPAFLAAKAAGKRAQFHRAPYG